jgi:hypothetical protein
VGNLEQEIQDLQIKTQRMEDAAPGTFSPEDTAEIRAIREDINRLNQEDDAMLAGLLCVGKHIGT